MSQSIPSAPLRFAPALEQPGTDEAQTSRELDATMQSIREKTFTDTGKANRSVHAKGHGLLHGEFAVSDGLSPTLAQGLFARPGRYPAVLRLSTIPGDILPDSVSTPRGAALKVVGVEGPRLAGSDGDVTQDFVMANAPAFSAPTAQTFLGNLRMLEKTTDKAEGAKQVLSHVARAAEAMVEAFGGKSPLVVTLGGQPATHILGESFFSQTPYLYGDYIAKFALVPISASLTALTDTRLDIDDTPDALRAAVQAHFAREGGTWAFQIQLCTNGDTMPIEDASVAWPQDSSPYVTVATLTCPPQDSWSPENRKRIDDGMAFSPWHGLAAHRPLGGVNRARKDTYVNSAEFRRTRNGCPLHEPQPSDLGG